MESDTSKVVAFLCLLATAWWITSRLILRYQRHQIELMFNRNHHTMVCLKQIQLDNWSSYYYTLSLCVFILYVFPWRCMCVHMSRGQESIVGVSLIFLRQILSLKMAFADSAKLAGQQIIPIPRPSTVDISMPRFMWELRLQPQVYAPAQNPFS